MRTALATCLIVAATAFLPTIARADLDAAASAKLTQAVASPDRDPANVARDKARQPVAALTFLGITPGMNVVEIWPGGGYWVEILGPYLKGSGQLTEALFGGKSEFVTKANKMFTDNQVAKPNSYGVAKMASFSKDGGPIVPAGTADAVLTFRNVHNWMTDDWQDKAFSDFFAALKPGGILGIEEHRGKETEPQDPKAKSGYVRQDAVIAMAEKAGFKLAAKSEIYANPKDTKDYPDGVWTLPPTYRLKDKDHAKYEAIGEADGMLLKFVKPAS